MVYHITHISTHNTKKVWKNHYSQGIIYLMVHLKKKEKHQENKTLTRNMIIKSQIHMYYDY